MPFHTYVQDWTPVLINCLIRTSYLPFHCLPLIPSRPISPFAFTWFNELTAVRLDNLMIWVATDHNWRRPSKSVKKENSVPACYGIWFICQLFIHSLLPLFSAFPHPPCILSFLRLSVSYSPPQGSPCFLGEEWVMESRYQGGWEGVFILSRYPRGHALLIEKSRN